MTEPANAPPQRPRLLIVGAFPPPGSRIYGGVVTSCRALTGSSLAERFELTLVDSTQISNPPPRLPMRALLALRRLTYFVRALFAVRPAAVLLFASAGASLLEKGAMAWMARLSGRPALLFPRGGRVMDKARDSRLHRLWIRAAFRGARVVLCQGPAWQRFLVEEVGFSEEMAPVVPNWTATPQLLAIGAERAQAGDGAAPRLLFLGWLEAEKGIFELLQACRELAPRWQFTLVVAGRGHAESDARRYVQQHGLGDHVHFAGWLEGPALHEELARGDIFVLPSWAEGLPNAMIEAMAAGLAVVATTVGNIPHVVSGEDEALLVPPRDVAALEAAMARVLGDRDLRHRLQRAGHALAARRFAVEPAMQRLGDVVMRLASARP